MPAKTYSCFLQPCYRQVTLKVIDGLPDMYACYYHATEIVAGLKDYDPARFGQARLESFNVNAALMAGWTPAPVELPPPLAPLVEKPECMFSMGDPRHLRAGLQVNYSAGGDDTVELSIRCCGKCLYDALQQLRESGHTHIKVTTPEIANSAEYQAWRVAVDAKLKS